MASILEYAYLSADVYVTDEQGIYNKDGQYVPQFSYLQNNWIGFPIPKLSKLNDTAFFARLYANLFSYETIIAYRGTVLTALGDYKADIELSIKKENKQNHNAIDFFNYSKNLLHQHANQRFSKFPKVTGHSLGGYLAQIVAAKYLGTIAVVFNAPKVGGFNEAGIGTINPNNPIYKKSVHNIDINYDLIHRVGQPIGTTEVLNGDYICGGIESMTAHSIQIPINIPYIFSVSGPAAYCVLYQEHNINRVIKSLQANLVAANQIIT